MSKPTQRQHKELRHLGRYLLGTMEYAHCLKLTDGIKATETFVDTNWGTSVVDRRSTSAAMVAPGGAAVMARCCTQSGLPATSSGQAELRAINFGSTEAIYVRNLLRDFLDITPNLLDIRVNSDSSAAKAISCKFGVGKLRHLAIDELFVQELQRTKRRWRCARLGRRTIPSTC